MTARPQALWPHMTPVRNQGDDRYCTVSANGTRITFADGRTLLCATSGLWNCVLGYGNEVIAGAVHDALLDASYLSVWRYENTYARRAADALVTAAGAEQFGRVLFSTSGGAANDLAMKVVRHFFALRGEHSRKGIIGLHGAWHGLTFGAAALTSGDLGHRVYGIDRRLVTHVSPNDTGELTRLLQQHPGRIGAVVVEPVIGTPALVLEDAYIADLLRLREEHGFLLVADEVTTGFWRVGPFFASQAWPEPPDLIITAKGLTNGTVAASAVIVSHRVAEAFVDAEAVLGHGETQAGTPPAAAAILATLAEMRRLDAAALNAGLSARLDTELAHLIADTSEVVATSGRGCLRAAMVRGPGNSELDDDEVAALVAAIRAEGAIVHPGPSCFQLLPALVYTDEDVAELFASIRAGIKRYFHEH
ncbi:adenosylmethionine-8-amino-7-oxononanoate aminotransferase [Actinokineospora baliensis]|uniref:daptide-type RiPP biosynthesis aminotransferase n=1 Tax=Actinokineospora baliensis TaxID=547056 RepID=UPI00195BB76E|nr:daptide-type RiPP biosynthesis aminotransferase [Actinokineospora baliensis]MBM7771688.1 adenosylmethionine-8-amino-7-oxononanoate aminotransferase [Actinokineospora baliensis]